jgi:hypothetical protein
MSSTALDRTGLNDTGVDDVAEGRESEIAQIDQYIGECRSMYQSKLINRKTQEEYDKMWLELRAERKVEYMKENIAKLYETISEAQDYEADFRRTLDQGVRQGWMNEDNKKEWIDRFNDEKVLEWDRKKWLREKFPEYVSNWQQVSRDRTDVLELAKKLGITAKQVPELNDLLNQSAFLGFHYRTRLHKVGKVKALLLSYDKKMEKFLSFIEEELESWVGKGIMHSSKVGPWMRRVMESDNPEAFASKVLYPFKNNWQEARDRYDAVMPELKKEKDKMRGFKPVSANKFLLMDYDQRIAYVEEAESRLESDVNEEGELAKLRLDIRHALDTEDWEEAETLLGEAQAIDADDKAVRSMGRYLATHRKDNLKGEEQEKTEAKNKGMEALRSQQEIMSKIPTNQRTMTEWAMHSTNPNAVKRVWQVLYNRHWVITHGYSTAQKDQEESFKEENKEETEESIANGHDWRFARRLIKGDTANDKGIRDECVKPQVIYTNRGGLRQVFNGVERNADNAKFGYWTTLIDDEVPYESLRESLQFMYDIRKNDRLMREAGIVYTSHGTPFSTN